MIVPYKFFFFFFQGFGIFYKFLLSLFLSKEIKNFHDRSLRKTLDTLISILQYNKFPISQSNVSNIEIGHNVVVVVVFSLKAIGQQLRPWLDGQLTKALFSWADLDLLSG